MNEDLEMKKKIETEIKEANIRTQIMLDATPLCSNFWDKNFNNIDCNQEAVKLFDLKNKQEYLDRFNELSPEYQPCGRLSSEMALEYIKTAFKDGFCRFEWMHQKLNGEPVPSEITLVRVKHKDENIVVGYTRDLREIKATLEKMREADERTQIMLDATPLCSNFWDKNFNNIDCNQEAVKLFDLKNKQEYLDRFNELSPEYQPCGRLSSELALEHIKTAFKDGFCRFEWLHQKLNGEPIESEIILVRVKHRDDNIVVGYTRDLRELKATAEKMRMADERTQIMLDATPLCSNFWDKDFNNIDCNQEAVKLFDLKNKQEYLDRFYDLSPEYQPCGRPSSEMALENITKAFKDGYCRFEWMHQKLNGEPIPSEITLVRVKHRDENIVVGYTRDLREIKATLEKMREADERTQIMLDATPLCCNLWDKDFNNIDCNQEAVKLFELKDKQEYLDRFFDLSPKYQPCGRLTSEMALENITKAFKDGYCRFEWMHRKLNGEPVPSEITLVRVKHRDEHIVAGYTRDLREIKATLEKMREADERTQIMLDATPLCCNLWDQNFNNIACNQEAVKLFDLKNKQEYLDRFNDLSPEFQPCGKPSGQKALEYIQTAFKDGYCKFEWMHRKLNGEPVPSEITLVRVKHRGEDIVAGYTRDLREFKAMLNDMHKVEADLRLARDAAQESARAKSEFLANMSHEIRSPMNGILGMLHLVLQTDVTDKQRDYLEKTQQSAKALLRIINDILDFSKIEAGKLEMESISFNFKEVIEEISTIFMPKIKEKGLEFKTNLPHDLPSELIGDSLRLKQVLINIIGNAIKFTKNGEISLTIEKEHQTEKYSTFKFAIVDTGIGMSKKHLSELFLPFAQADTSITRNYGGTGLGLAISKNLVNLMNGDIWATSESGKGSAFYFTAQFENPASKASEGDLADESTTQDKHSKASTSSDSKPESNGASILLVEDMEINQIIAQEILEMEGYHVDIANNGQEAIEKLQTNKYALVLMDIQMPIMDGLTATKKIRELGTFNDLPIIAMSAHAMTGDKEKSLRGGMNDHLTKPFDPVVLFATLKKWIP